MENIVANSLVQTLVIVLIIPILGLVIGQLQNIIAKVISRLLGGKIAYIVINMLMFIGVVHHELSHALLALVTGAKIVSIELFHPQNGTLGKVKFIPRGNKIIQSVQLTLSAIAPVIIGCVSEYILITYVLASTESVVIKCVVYYLIISILMHMTMSKQDIKNAIKGLPACSLLIFIIVSIVNYCR